MAANWKSQLANGRVFELRSKSTRYPAPCGLVVDETANCWGKKLMVAVDRFGVIGNGMYRRRQNPGIYVEGIRRDQFTGKRIARRRRDLERFDFEDLALVRHGYGLDFDGKITRYPEPHIPIYIGIPSQWTVFWLPAWDEADSRWVYRDHATERRVFSGAWWFSNHGGCRHLGYKFGRCWATRHTGRRLTAIRDFLWASFSDVIEQQNRVVRWNDSAGNIYTTEVRRECPALGGSAVMYIQTPRDAGGVVSIQIA